jgi:selenium metabolism protein YedF
VHDQTANRHDPFVVLFASDRIGDGPEELGRVLARSFVKTLHEQGLLPWRMVFLNSGIALTTEGSPVAEDLRAMEAAGAEILSCGTCLDYFHAKEKLVVGRVSNMREIVETLNQAGRLLRP